MQRRDEKEEGGEGQMNRRGEDEERRRRRRYVRNRDTRMRTSERRRRSTRRRPRTSVCSWRKQRILTKTHFFAPARDEKYENVTNTNMFCKRLKKGFKLGYAKLSEAKLS